MTTSPLHLPGDKLRKALLEYGESLQENKNRKKSEILAHIQQKYDLSPLECSFLERQILEQKEQ